MGGPTVQEYLVAFWNVENLFDVDTLAGAATVVAKDVGERT